MNIGLYFGTFDPIHVGHLAIANIMVEDTNLDKVWFVVSPHNPFKEKANITSEHDRLEMVRLAVFENYNLEARDTEFFLPQPSYTVDTLTHLRTKKPTNTFSLIMGEDNLSHFHKWKNHEQILKHHQLLVYPRNNSKPHQLGDTKQIVKVGAPLIDISATYLRNAIKNKRSAKYLIPEEALEYIDRKGLYA